MNKNIKKIKSIAFLCLFIFFLSVSFSGQACTIFNKQKENLTLVGNNEDWIYSAPSSIQFAAADEGTYGRLCFYLYSYVQGGMNEKGLFYDGATCPSLEVPHLEGKPALDMDLGEVVLSNCANVDEVIKFLKSYNLPSGFMDHLMFVDAAGNSVVIEWDENDLKFIKKEGSYQIATNFWLANPEMGGYPCGRYDKAKSMLEDEEGDLSVDYFATILESTTQNWDDGGTKYSNIYDLKNKEVFIYLKGDFEKSIKYSLLEELEKLKQGETINLSLEKLEYSNNTVSEKNDNTLSTDGSILDTAEPEDAIQEALNDTDTATLKEADIQKSSQPLNGTMPYIFIIIVIAAMIPILYLVFRKITLRKK